MKNEMIKKIHDDMKNECNTVIRECWRCKFKDLCFEINQCKIPKYYKDTEFRRLETMMKIANILEKYHE